MHGVAALGVSHGHVHERGYRVAVGHGFALAYLRTSICSAMELEAGLGAAVGHRGGLAVTLRVYHGLVPGGHGRADADAHAAPGRTLTRHALATHHRFHLLALFGRHVGHRLLHLGVGGGHLSRHVAAIDNLVDLLHLP